MELAESPTRSTAIADDRLTRLRYAIARDGHESHRPRGQSDFSEAPCRPPQYCVRPLATPGDGLQLQCGALESQAMFANSTGTDCVDEKRHSSTKRIECIALCRRAIRGRTRLNRCDTAPIGRDPRSRAQCGRFKGVGVAHNALCVRSEMKVNGRKGSVMRRKGVGRRRKGVVTFLKGFGTFS